MSLPEGIENDNKMSLQVSFTIHLHFTYYYDNVDYKRSPQMTYTALKVICLEKTRMRSIEPAEEISLLDYIIILVFYFNKLTRVWSVNPSTVSLSL